MYVKNPPLVKESSYESEENEEIEEMSDKSLKEVDFDNIMKMC
jgi:hypothetical protein